MNVTDLFAYRRRLVETQTALAASRRFGKRWCDRAVALQAELDREKALATQVVGMNLRLVEQLAELERFIKATHGVPVVDE